MRGLSALCCALVLTACASAPHRTGTFDPLTFLKSLTLVGEGTCRLVSGGTAPCKSFEDEQTGLTYVALYHPELHNLVAIKELRPDGTQANVWSRPIDERKRVVRTQGSTST